MNPKNIIERLKAIRIYGMLAVKDSQAIEEAIKYIEENEDRSAISRPNPLFPNSYDLHKSDGD